MLEDSLLTISLFMDVLFLFAAAFILRCNEEGILSTNFTGSCLTGIDSFQLMVSR